MDSPESTVYFGNLDSRVDEEILFELVLQIADVVSVHIPRDKISLSRSGFGFVQLFEAAQVPLVMDSLNGLRLFGRPLRCARAGTHQREPVKVTARVFVGHLAADVDEQTLKQVFEKFGALAALPSIARNAKGISKGHGLVEFEQFDAADAAIAALNGKILMNSPCVVEYALRGTGTDRHGDEAERKIASLHSAMNGRPLEEQAATTANTKQKGGV